MGSSNSFLVGRGVDRTEKALRVKERAPGFSQCPEGKDRKKETELLGPCGQGGDIKAGLRVSLSPISLPWV